MVDVYLGKQLVESVFQLLGQHENDITNSVAWALARCPAFLRAFVRHATGWSGDCSEASLFLQKHETAGGITDVEIVLQPHFHIIAEAKRGWNLPTRVQLETYARRDSFSRSDAAVKKLVVLSECSPRYALDTLAQLDARTVAGNDVVPISWKEMHDFASGTREKGSNAEKRLTKELLHYLRGLMTMQNVDSNEVFVVSLRDETEKGWSISWIDIVKKKSRYFHPVGGRGKWPKVPPNYIAFRYHGRLQSIHHVEGVDYFTNPHKVIPEIPDDEWPTHFSYKLGPAFAPAKAVRTGNIYPSGRVRCMLDTLFTCGSISEARDLSKKRKAASG